MSQPVIGITLSSPAECGGFIVGLHARNVRISPSALKFASPRPMLPLWTSIVTLGLDIDDTITRHPAFFALVSASFIAAGHRVVIITMRTDRAGAEAELARHGIQWTELHVFPEDLHWSKLWPWKGDVCRERGVDVFFDDSPDILVHMPASTVPFLTVDLARHPLHRMLEAEDIEEIRGGEAE